MLHILAPKPKEGEFRIFNQNHQMKRSEDYRSVDNIHIPLMKIDKTTFHGSEQQSELHSRSK